MTLRSYILLFKDDENPQKYIFEFAMRKSSVMLRGHTYFLSITSGILVALNVVDNRASVIFSLYSDLNYC